MIVVMMVSNFSWCERLEGISDLQMIARVSNQFKQWLCGTQISIGSFLDGFFLHLFNKHVCV